MKITPAVVASTLITILERITPAISIIKSEVDSDSDVGQEDAAKNEALKMDVFLRQWLITDPGGEKKKCRRSVNINQGREVVWKITAVVWRLQ